MALSEFQRLLSSTRYQLRVRKLSLPLAPDLAGVSLPRARIYVLDACAPRPAIENLLASILERRPRARVLVVAEQFNETNAFPFLRLGVKGLLRYAETHKHLRRAVEAVGRGGFWVPRSLLSRFVDSVLPVVRDRRPLPGLAVLTRREREILDALVENLSNKEIASKLYISDRTVKFHVSNLLAKFGVRRRADLILLCFQGIPMGIRR